jgi:hypothetical protein
VVAVRKFPNAEFQHESLLNLFNYLVTIADVIHLGSEFFKQDLVLIWWHLIHKIREAKQLHHKQIELELGGVNKQTAMFSQKCEHEGIRIWSVRIENQMIDYDWCHTYLAQPKFIDNGNDKIFTGKLYPEVITFKDCSTPLVTDSLIGMPNCKTLHIFST